jgi:hypothetical protein
MTWLSSPLPRNVKHSEAALSASKGVENLKTRGEEMRGLQVTQQTWQDDARVCHSMYVLHAVREGNMCAQWRSKHDSSTIKLRLTPFSDSACQ